MKTLRTFLEEARAARRAIGHFNISDMAAFKAIIEAARSLGVPVMIGVSEGERAFVGVHEASALVRAARDAYGVPVFLNADHTHTVEKAVEAAKAGFDEVLLDASAKSFEENVRLTRQAVEAIREINPEIIIEGEIGYIGSSSEVLASAPEGAALTPELFTTPEEAAQFIKETGVDVLAPAVGTMHGLLASMVSGEVKKRLDIKRIGEIAEATGAFLTLHGGSGTADEDFVAAVHAGITIVHVNTELRLAWKNGITSALASHPDEVAPYKILPEAVAQVRSVVEQRLRLFNS
jgi:fructose-bisphosphate aldolase class II